MTPHPPLAERLLTWSLAPADREAVLGDLQEEFAALVEASGAPAARRWYWAQTLTSVVPNLLRRIQGERTKRRLEEDEADRMMRMSIRRFSLWLIAVPIALGLLFWEQDWDPLPIVALGGYVAFFGWVLLIGSLSPARAVDAETAARQRRRYSLFWGILLVAGLPRLLLDPQYHQLSGWFRAAGDLLSLAVLLWPKRHWPVRIVLPPTPPRIRTPFKRSGWEKDGSLFLSTATPEHPGLGDLILGSAHDLKVGISRVFQHQDALRVYAAVGEGSAPVQARIDLLDQGNNLIASIPAPISPVKFIEYPDTSPPTSTEHAAQIDATLPLAGLAPGPYRLRVTATDGVNVSEQHADFTVAGSSTVDRRP
jgi:hypothetical protein